jgi:[acyl-carrier-protein] S-malonyltransferase
MLALLFPGQGSQEVGMGRDVFEASPAARSTFEAADAALGFPLSRLCFEGPEQELRRTELQQPAILATSVAILRALEEITAVSPAYVAGHSLGEFTALVAAGALDFEDAVALVHARGRFMQEAVPDGKGAMAAIMGCGPDQVIAACQAAERASGGVAAPANYNSPRQVVISGNAATVELAGSEARKRGARRAVPLPVSAPFHCSLMEPAAEKLAGELGRVRFSDPRVPVVTNVEAEPNSDATRIAELLRRQVTAPVRFTESVQCLARLGVTRLLEVGPGRVLCGLVARIDRSFERLGASTMSEVADVAAALKD